MLHGRARRGQPLVPAAGGNAAVALRTVRPGAVLDASAAWTPAKRFQQATSEQCWRFVDSDVYYRERELSVLLQVRRVAFFAGCAYFCVCVGAG